MVNNYNIEMSETKWRTNVAAVAVSLVLVLPIVQCQTMPAGCSYDDGMFVCSYSTLSGSSNIPLSASLFTPIPQRIRLTDLPASLTTTVFDQNFSNLSISDYDENYPATLELKCASGPVSTLTLGSGFLTNMDHIDDFKIINCHLGSIPSGVFSELGSLDRFSIENGSIVSMDAGMLNGISIERVYSEYRPFPVTNGEFAIRHTKLSSGSIPAGLLSGQTSLYSVVLEGMELQSISSSQFSSNTNLRFLSLGYNELTELPSGLLDGLSSLGEINLYDTTLSCSCDTLWFMTHSVENYISLYGDIMCNNGDYADKLALRYFHENNCASATGTECDGLMMMGSCMHMIDLVANIIGLIFFIIGWVVLVLAIRIRKQMTAVSGATPRNRRPPPYPGRRGPVNTRKGWE